LTDSSVRIDGDFCPERFRVGGSTRYFTSGIGATALTTLALTANRLYAAPFFVPCVQSFDRIAINVTTAGAAGTLARIGIYYDNGATAPGELTLDSGDIAVNATGVKQVNISISLSMRLIWLAIVASAAVTIRALAVGSSNAVYLGNNSSLGAAWGSHYYAAFAYAPLPAAFGAVTFGTGAAPAVFLRKV